MNKIVFIVILLLLLIVGYIMYQTIINQKPPVTLLFDGTGYTTFAASGDYNTTTTNFSCNIKTKNDNGLVLFGKADDDDMFSVRLHGGHVVVEIETGSGVVMLYSNTRVSDEEWHTIKLTRDGQHILLRVDTEHITGHTGAMSGITRPNIIYVGGSILDISNTVQGFVGCMKNITFGDRLAKDIEFDLTVGGVILERYTTEKVG